MPRYDASYLGDIKDAYEKRRREVANAKPIKLKGVKLKRALPNPVVEWEKQQGYR
jgi:hypothetical protein